MLNPHGLTAAVRALLPTTHDACFIVLMVDESGELDLSSNDRGNYNSGIVGVGPCTGSRWGISSATYPSVDKLTLTRIQASGIYLRDFWLPSLCNDLPPPLRFLVYTSGANSGASMAATWLQRAILAQGIAFGGGADGRLGPKTLAASLRAEPGAMAREFSAQRLFTLSQDPIFADDRLGLSRRLVNDAATASLPVS